MKSPTSECIKHLIRFYNFHKCGNQCYEHERGHPWRSFSTVIDFTLYHEPWYNDNIDYTPYPENEDFDEYCLRIINS